MRWRFCFFMWLVCLLSVSVSANANDDLEKSIELYQETQSRQTELLKQAFERKLKDVTKTGNLDLVQELKTEESLFLESGTVPASTTMKSFGEKYSKALQAARKKVEDTYDRVIKIETRAGRIEDAKKFQEELRQLDAVLGGQPLAAPVAPVDPGPLNPPANAPAPSKKPKPNSPVTPIPNFQIHNAVWKQDGLHGSVGEVTLDALAVLTKSLATRGTFEISAQTLGVLDGRQCSKSLFANLLVGDVPMRLRLSENSRISVRLATAKELALPGKQVGDTSLELVETLFVLRDQESKFLNLTDVVLAELPLGPVEVRPPVFEDFAPGNGKVAIFRFRSGRVLLELRAGDYSQIVAPFDDSLPLTVESAVWKYDGRIGPAGTQADDVKGRVMTALRNDGVIRVESKWLGNLEGKNASKSLYVHLKVPEAEFNLELREGSRISILDATRTERSETGVPLGATSIEILDLWYKSRDESSGGSGSGYIPALISGPLVIEGPLFENTTGFPKIAVLRCRVEGKILLIGASDSSIIHLKH